MCPGYFTLDSYDTEISLLTEAVNIPSPLKSFNAVFLSAAVINGNRAVAVDLDKLRDDESTNLSHLLK